MPACGSSPAAAPASVDPQPTVSGPLALIGKPAPAFSLVDQFDHGQHLTSFRGKVVLLTFVSTRCTDICPLTAELMSQIQDRLGTRTMQLVAINANEVHRSVSDVLQWSRVHSMTDRWLFLTGSLHQLISVYADYDITPGGAHTIVVYIIDPQGRVRNAIPVSMKRGLSAEARIVAKYVRQLRPSSA